MLTQTLSYNLGNTYVSTLKSDEYKLDIEPNNFNEKYYSQWQPHASSSPQKIFAHQLITFKQDIVAERNFLQRTHLTIPTYKKKSIHYDIRIASYGLVSNFF